VVMPHFSKTRIDSSSRSVSFSTGFDSGLSANDEILQNYGNHSLSFESKRAGKRAPVFVANFVINQSGSSSDSSYTVRSILILTTLDRALIFTRGCY
jgi:hypothetical protein